ncbi:uncharacterized protein BDR25DRAFT_303762 [Lindgomyces ingoldianus]|uniref:Uncharacterized protein n=1 Tax=Lindgomyces ingoldianus TaxID=673940 RepID=A0ACB6QUT9_9PLEO|nr:uncharacterized protein BDR25DRAFT_303762 [Lindgomyces ingoldianus]KAF2470773.1 hypothetical protein BDR25DRAFT_303762 [Lindgomyces ingoldianus]
MLPFSLEDSFKPPPIVECLSGEECLGFGKKVHVPNKLCMECLRRYDPEQLRLRADGNVEALGIIDEEIARKQQVKGNMEARGRFLCAFEDPDYQDRRWRRPDLNLRGTRLSCAVVKTKGMACGKCWRRHLEKIAVVQYFNPAGLCHEEADKVVGGILTSRSGSSAINDDEDDVEGYNIVMS